MAHHHAKELNTDSLQMGNLTPRLVGIGVLLAVLGLGSALYYGFQSEARERVFYHAYLVVFLYFLSVTLGALFFVVLQHLARAGWSVTVRRIAEGLTGNFYLLALLFIPLIPGLHYLYEWIDPEFMKSDPALRAKAGWLTHDMVLIRFAVYFAVWLLVSWCFRSGSARQDKDGSLAISHKLEFLSAPSMIAFALTSTFAAFDLMMSMNPHWSSTIFGVYFFAGSVLSFLVLLTLICLWLQKWGKLKDIITTEHYHDLGKLTFAFTFFWGYIAFSQYMLIWYANMPEETQFYIPRQIGPWMSVSLILLFCHLLIPFGGMLSRHSKRGLAIFTFWGIWLLAAHLLDLFWVVMPNMYINEMTEAVKNVTGHKPDTLVEAMHDMVQSNQSIYTLKPEYAGFMENIRSPLHGLPIVLVASLFVGIGGLYMISTALLLRSKPLAPLKDPRLPEALAFENV